MKLKKKAALVTGAGQGIGRSIALSLAKEGADLIVNDITMESAQRVVDELKALDCRAEAYAADVSNSDQVNEMAEKAISFLGKIDILVNNAGILKVVPAEAISEKDWDRIIAVNLKGPFLCCQAFGRYMIQQGHGKIINISSVSGHRGRPGNIAYCSSKGGVLQLTRALSAEWAKYNITINSVTPGLTITPILEKAGVNSEERAKKIPLGRVNQPEDIAHAVVFLASEDANNITGQDIIVDCGLSALHPGYLMQL